LGNEQETTNFPPVARVFRRCEPSVHQVI